MDVRNDRQETEIIEVEIFSRTASQSLEILYTHRSFHAASSSAYSLPALVSHSLWLQEKGLGDHVLALIDFALNWLLSTLLATVALLWCWLFVSVLDWTPESASKSACILLGSVLSSWGVAQFASFLLQTSGHEKIGGVLVAIRGFGPVLLCSISMGWLLAWTMSFKTKDWWLALRALIAIAPTTIAALLMKTFLKLVYFRERVNQGLDSAEDAFGRKLKRSLEIRRHVSCPFQHVTFFVVLGHAAKPITCFIMTGVFVFGLRPLIVAAAQIENDALKGFVKGSILFVGLFVYYKGSMGISGALNKSKGPMLYSYKMSLVLFVVFMHLTASQILLLIVSSVGPARLIFSVAHPLMLLLIRARGIKIFRSSFAQLCALSVRICGAEGTVSCSPRSRFGPMGV